MVREQSFVPGTWRTQCRNRYGSRDGTAGGTGRRFRGTAMLLHIRGSDVCTKPAEVLQADHTGYRTG